MKIAIYGDSYADIDAPATLEKTHKCWINHFEDIYDVTCYGKFGTSLYYSKQLFDQTHESYDKIIFMITNPGRYHIKSDKSEKNFIDVAGIGRIEKLLVNNNISESEKNRLKIYRDYILYVRDDNYETYIHNLMIKDIVTTRSDIMMVPCFNNSMQSESKSLWDISCHELKLMNLTYPLKDVRRCHMTKENNFRLFEILDKGIKSNQTRIELNVENFVSDFDRTQRFILTD